MFTLCEVSDNSCHSSSYFVACDEHFFGINCSQKCDKSCVNKTCLHETGECQSPHKVHFLNISMFLSISINFTGFVITPYFRLYYNMVYLIIMLHDGEKKKQAERKGFKSKAHKQQNNVLLSSCLFQTHDVRDTLIVSCVTVA